MTAARANLTHCPACRYDLTGLPAEHTCPECGFAYDATMRYWRLRGNWAPTGLMATLGPMAMHQWFLGLQLFAPGGGAGRLGSLRAPAVLYGLFLLALLAGGIWMAVRYFQYSFAAISDRELIFRRPGGRPVHYPLSELRVEGPQVVAYRDGARQVIAFPAAAERGQPDPMAYLRARIQAVGNLPIPPPPLPDHCPRCNLACALQPEAAPCPGCGFTLDESLRVWQSTGVVAATWNRIISMAVTTLLIATMAAAYFLLTGPATGSDRVFGHLYILFAVTYGMAAVGTVVYAMMMRSAVVAIDGRGVHVARTRGRTRFIPWSAVRNGPDATGQVVVKRKYELTRISHQYIL